MRNPQGIYSVERLVPLADYRRKRNPGDPEVDEYAELLGRVYDNNATAG